MGTINLRSFINVDKLAANCGFSHSKDLYPLVNLVLDSISLALPYTKWPRENQDTFQQVRSYVRKFSNPKGPYDQVLQFSKLSSEYIAERGSILGQVVGEAGKLFRYIGKENAAPVATPPPVVVIVPSTPSPEPGFIDSLAPLGPGVQLAYMTSCTLFVAGGAMIHRLFKKSVELTAQVGQVLENTGARMERGSEYVGAAAKILSISQTLQRLNNSAALTLIAVSGRIFLGITLTILPSVGMILPPTVVLPLLNVTILTGGTLFAFNLCGDALSLGKTLLLLAQKDR